METIVMNKDMTNSKIKTLVKAEMIELFMEFLNEKGYGAAMIRTDSTSPSNEIGFIAKMVDKNGEELPVTVSINPTVKEFEDRKTAKKTYTAFDFEAGKARYENYIADKELKAADAKANKEAKIARDKAARAKKTEDEE